MPVSILAVAATAFVMNVPLGIWRETTRRFSWQWFLAIHLAVPVVIVLRQANDLPFALAPLMLGLAVAGQVVGSRYWRRRRVPAAVAALDQARCE